MMLPLAPAKRISWIRMPPEVCVRWAKSPPATIRTSPAIANDHRLRIKTSRMTRAVEAGFQVRFFRLVFAVIDTVTKIGMRESRSCETHLRLRYQSQQKRT